FGYSHHITILQFLSGYDNWIDFGVLWFAGALLLFTLLYAMWRMMRVKTLQKEKPFPSTSTILLFSIGLGALSFLVRIIFPIGWILKPLGFQLGHFPQYIVTFILGIVASRSNWLNKLNYRQGKRMVIIAACVVILIFPLFYILLTWLKFPSSYFSGGFVWPSLLYALWEQTAGITTMTALLCIGKQLLNKSSGLRSRLSRSAFAVYIFHPLVLICLSLALKNWPIEPALKLLVVAPLAVTGSFLFGSVIVMIPGVKSVV
ncbi:MAG: acyltransferase family protein, partial [Mucilaginibacter sp.]